MDYVASNYRRISGSVECKFCVYLKFHRQQQLNTKTPHGRSINAARNIIANEPLHADKKCITELNTYDFYNAQLVLVLSRILVTRRWDFDW
jgi:hypothetical protein